MKTTEKQRKVVVCSEAEYTSGIDQIVQRDYFPELVGEQQQQQQRRRQGRQVVGGALGSYLRTHTSEDNARFRQAVSRDRQRRDERYARVFGSGQGRSHGRSGYLLEPPPPGAAAATAVPIAGGGPRTIVLRNTRLPAQQSQLLSMGEEGEEEEEEDGEASSVAGTPVIGGYRMLRDPGAAAGGGGFRMAAPSPREAAALQLGKRPSMKKRGVSGSGIRGGSFNSGGGISGAVLSPAAHRLRKSTDGLGLGRAYSSPR
ncbi:hypothetical protein GGF42_005697 [Coemansia sp. RSA 2424]|nr:hypothetical protein GGF42_005697 [Coemansia sp. RSA 2424]